MTKKEIATQVESQRGLIEGVDYEGLGSLYDDPNIKAARVIAFAYNDPFEKMINTIRKGEDIDEVIQIRSRVWVLLNDGGALREVSIKDVDIVGLSAPKLHKNSRDMQEYLYKALIENSPLRGTFGMSSVPVIKAETDNVKNDPVSKRLFNLQKVLKTPGNKKWQKENYDKWRKKLEVLMGAREKVNNPEYISHPLLAEIVGVTYGVITSMSSGDHKILNPDYDSDGRKQFRVTDIPRAYLANEIHNDSSQKSWRLTGSALGAKVIKYDDKFYRDTWYDPVENDGAMIRARNHGIDVSEYGSDQLERIRYQVKKLSTELIRLDEIGELSEEKFAEMMVKRDKIKYELGVYQSEVASNTELIEQVGMLVLGMIEEFNTR